MDFRHPKETDYTLNIVRPHSLRFGIFNKKATHFMMNKMPYICNVFSSCSWRQVKLAAVTALFYSSGCLCLAAEESFSKLPRLPMDISIPNDEDLTNGYMEIKLEDSTTRKTTLVPYLQKHLSEFIQERSNPISATVMIEVKTGKILAIVQGKSPESWGAVSHTALHAEFPSASLFKTVVTAAAFEFAHIDLDTPEELNGGCAYVPSTGRWMDSQAPGPQNNISLRKAFGHSCNGFFAKIAIKKIGLGPIITMATRLGWNSGPIPADFQVPISPIKIPSPQLSSASTVGKFAAGFGSVGMSAIHAAWQALIIANDGKTIPLRLFNDETSLQNLEQNSNQIINVETAQKIREVMKSTIHSGTAALAFNRGAYREIKDMVGGKTGTLNGTFPRGVTTWFVGIMPIENPEVVIASVVILEDRWIFKAPNLAAEALLAYANYKNRIENEHPLTASSSEEKKSLPSSVH